MQEELDGSRHQRGANVTHSFFFLSLSQIFFSSDQSALSDVCVCVRTLPWRGVVWCACACRSYGPVLVPIPGACSV